MNRFDFIWAVALALALTACGGGGSSDTAPVAASPPPRQAVILFVGDSTQQGHVSPASRTDHPPSAVAASILPQAIVINEAFGATWAEEMLDGSDGSGVSWPVRLSRHGATIVSILHGMNGKDTGAQHAVVLRQLVTQARAQGVEVVLETPNPMVAGGIIAMRRDPVKFLQRVQAIRDVAAEMNVTLCDHFAAMTAAGLDNLTAIPDGVHPSPAVYDFMGDQDAGCLAPLVSG